MLNKKGPKKQIQKKKDREGVVKKLSVHEKACQEDFLLFDLFVNDIISFYEKERRIT